MKNCKKCGANKPLTEFYKDSTMLDGHLNQCKACVLERCSKRRKSKIDYVRWYDRQRYLMPKRARSVKVAALKYNKKHRERIAKRTSKWQRDNPEKYAVHTIVGNAIQAGWLKRQPCEKCGDPKSQAHHEDYSKPLRINWLCCKHHNQRHAELKRLKLQA